jgi:glutamyl-tRNA(Gln) and/or aspartyl-tRNA(Asn) amidotransferase, B subunit
MAREFLETLRNILRYAGVSKADMEKGQLRCDINLSLRPKGSKELGTKVEIKNVNSFRFVQKAIESEIERQKKILSSGGKIIQETRTFDPSTGLTHPMRTKEEAEDYRYFPDPDLLPLVISKDWIEQIKNSMPELPHQRIERFIKAYALTPYEAKVLTDIKELGDFFEASLKFYDKDPKLTSNWILNDFLGLLRENNLSVDQSPVSPEKLAQLVKLIKEGVLSSKLAKEVLAEMFATGEDPQTIVEKKGLKQISDESAIMEIVQQVFNAYPNEYQRLKSGESKLIGFFVGQVMKATKGKANPQLVNKLISEVISK